MLPRVARVLSLISYVLPVLRIASCFHIMGQIQIHYWSLRRRELFTVSRQVAPLLRIWGEVCCRRFPCSQLYTNIYSVVKYRLYGSVFLANVFIPVILAFILKIVFRVFFCYSYDEQRYLTYTLIWMNTCWMNCKYMLQQKKTCCRLLRVEKMSLFSCLCYFGKMLTDFQSF